MKRACKDLSGRITPLFDTMMVQASKEVGEDSGHPTDSTQVPILDRLSTSSKPKKKQPSKKTQIHDAEVSQDETEHEESVPIHSNDPQPSVASTTIEEITLAHTLIQIKEVKPKVVTTAATTTTTTRPKDKRVVVQGPSKFRVPQEVQPLIYKDKGKCIMIEPEVPLKRKDQIALDEQIARDIQAKLDAELIKESKLARKQEEEANIALIELWENT
ncbi:hypothetical protein Tco_1353864 [Tanacetum coccineum]